MKFTRKSISIILALIMILGVVAIAPITASADIIGGTTGECDWTFDTETGRLAITGSGAADEPAKPGNDCPWYEYSDQITSLYIGLGASCTPTNVGSNIYIPNVTSVEIGNSVKKICWNTFYNCTKLKTLKLSSGLTEIQEEAFSGCKALTSVTFPDTLTTIGKNAFEDCKKLATVKFGKRLKTIGFEAFSWCTALKSVSIPDSVTEIKGSAFLKCTGLEKASIGKGVAKIGTYAFGSCHKLSKFTVNSKNAKYASSSGNLLNKKKTKLVCYPMGKSTKKYTVPKSVKTIGTSAFDGANKITELKTNKVTTINKEAIVNCTALKKLVLGDSLKKLGNYPIYGNDKLTTISIGKNLNLKSNAFSGRDVIKKITVSKKNKNLYVKNSGLYNKKTKALIATFNLKKTTNFKVPSGIKTIKANAIDGSKYVKSITLPKSVTKVESEAFYGCYKLTKVTVKNPKLDLSNSWLGIDGDEEHIRTNITIVCNKGSQAAKFAKAYGFKVKYL